MTLAEKQQRLLDDLAFIEDPQERLALVVARAKKLSPLAEPERTDANRVHGCVSLVYLVGALAPDGTCRFRCEADSPLVLGLVALLCDFFHGATPSEIAASDADPLAALGLTRHLSPTRRHGLASARAHLRAFAQSHVSP